MFLAKKLNKGAGTPALTTDPQFNYVTMLLHGDGTNGSQNNTFLDSRNNFTITRNGNPTQGSFSPYGSNWSNYFNAEPDFFTVNQLASRLGTGDWTMECWICPKDTPQNYASILNKNWVSGGIPTGDYQWSAKHDDGYMSFAYSTGTITNVTTTIEPTVGVWQHVAVTRVGTTLRIYANGVLNRTATLPGGLSFGTANTNAFQIAKNTRDNSYYRGYISNLRILIGTALYTGSTYTVPTSALTAITNTALLTCQTNRFSDSSANNYSVTPSGTSSVQRFNPFGASTAYSTSVIGGSGYFDGSGDWLNYTGSSISTSVDFTFSIWFYHIGTMSGNKGIFCSSNSRFGILAEVGNIYILASTDIAPSPSVKIPVNQWNYLAITRTSNTLRGFLNGTQVGGAVSNSQSLSSFRIGSNEGGEIISNCYMSDARVLIGTGGTTISVPTAPLTAITNTNFLCNFTNGAIFDNAMMNDLETVGNAQISTSVKKFGTGSLAFDGTGDWLRSLDNLGIAFGSGNFTVEGWIYLNNVSATKGIMFGIGNNSFGIRVGQSYLGNVNGLNITRSGVADLEYCAFTFATSTWYHIAVVRSGTTIYFFVNGTQQTTQGSGGSSYNFATPTSGFIVGANNDTNEPFNGYMDDFRITKGYARYTANFTPPTAAFFDTGPV
jgi:hypothetical protein